MTRPSRTTLRRDQLVHYTHGPYSIYMLKTESRVDLASRLYLDVSTLFPEANVSKDFFNDWRSKAGPGRGAAFYIDKNTVCSLLEYRSIGTFVKDYKHKIHRRVHMELPDIPDHRTLVREMVEVPETQVEAEPEADYESESESDDDDETDLEDAEGEFDAASYKEYLDALERSISIFNQIVPMRKENNLEITPDHKSNLLQCVRRFEKCICPPSKYRARKRACLANKTVQ